MADASAQIEAGARTFVPQAERKTPHAPSVEAKIKKVEERMREKNGREAVQEAFTPTDKKEPLGFDSQVALERKLEGNIPDAPTTGLTAGPERQAYENAEKTVWAAQRLTEVGFDRTQLAPEEVTLLETEVTKRLDSIEGFKSIKNPDERKAIIEGMLNDKNFQKKLRDALQGSFSEDDMDRQMKAAKDAFDLAQKAVDVNSTALTDTQTKLDEFNLGQLKAQELQDLELNLNPRYRNETIDSIFSKAAGRNVPRAELLTIQQRVEQKMKKVPPDPITDPEEEAMEKILTGKADALRLDSLVAEKEELAAKKKDLQDKVRQLEEERDQRAADRDTASTGKADRDNALIQRMNNLIGEATDAYVKDNINEFNNAWDVVTAEDEKAATDRDEKILSGITRRWGKEKYSGGKIKAELNRKQIDEDLEHIAGDPTRGVNKGQGLEKFISERLKDGVTDPAELTRIDERMKDPEFVKEQKGKIAVELVRAKILSGGKLTNEQGNRLLNDPDVADSMRVELVRKAREIEAKTGNSLLSRYVDTVARGKDAHGLLYALAILIGAPLAFTAKQVAH